MQASWRALSWIGIMAALSVAAGCGSKAAPSPNTTHHKSANNAQNTKRVQSAGGGPGPTHALRPYSAPPAKLPAASVSAGQSVYSSTCASCHGSGGTGTGKAPRLAHPSNIMTRYGSEAALEVFIAHNMPASNPGSLSTGDAVNVAAYVWRIAGGK